MSSVPEDSSPASVVAAIVVDDPAALPDTLEAVRGQVYEPARVVVVGGGDEARLVSGAEDVPWAASLTAVIEALPTTTSHLWVVHDGSVPLPDALGALVAGSERVGAGIAGSKILNRSDPDQLLSVGMATDVFEVPYTGLDSGERDQGQYDVVRDVAAVAGTSMLLRRDLAKGLQGPDPAMAPVTAAVDLCQRARLRGARVVVLPSSEVLSPEVTERAKRWREDASRTRAMIKAYGWVTLLWALPALLGVSIIESILAPFAGSWRLFDWLKAWGWNIFVLPSSIRMRASARKGRVVGDEELFRYQRKGSVGIATMAGTLADNVRSRLPGDDRLSLDALGRDLRQPAVVSGLLSLLFILLAVRGIWADGLPAVGWSLPFPMSGWDAALAYAGGWNPAGLGSPEALVPLIGVTGVVQRVLFDDSRLAEYAFVLAAYVFGIWGMVRLLRTLSIQAAPGVVAGAVYMAGPAAQSIAADTSLGTLFALGVLPWALRIPLARWPKTWFGRIGRVAATGAVVGFCAALSPLLLVVPLALITVWALLNIKDGAAWRAVGMVLAGTAIGALLLLPWIGLVDLNAFVTTGEAFWRTSVVVVVAIAVAAAATIVAAPTRLAFVAGWGAVLVTGGALAARSADLGFGREVENAALAVVSLGAAAIVGAAIESVTRVREVEGWRRFVVGVGAVVSLFVVVTAFLPVIGGRAGLPGDRFTAAFEFTMARPGVAADSRILVVGPPEDLPGGSRLIEGASYRVVSAPMPNLWEAALNAPLAGDDALHTTLAQVIDGETQRAGQLLSQFGIRWIVVMGDPAAFEGDPLATAWLNVFEGQLDLVPLGGGLDHPTFENEDEGAVRAITTGGAFWTKTDAGYEGVAERLGRVTLAENANSRWQPGNWSQIDWRSEVDASSGRADFKPIERSRSQALAAALGFLLLLGLGWRGRRSG